MRLPLLILTALLLCVPPADARTAPCVPDGAVDCRWWTAKVKLVADGDTLEVRVGGKREQIRLTGINAMELTRYSRSARGRRGACHGVEAAAFVDRFVRRGDRVRLAAQDPASRSGRRLRRSVWVRHKGAWRDLAALSLAAGHALWLPNDVEDVHNAEYARLAADAVAAGRNLYDPDACGAGPDATAALVVNWDADGTDARNLAGEWVDVRNEGAAPLDLSGWWLRDSALRYSGKTPGYRFPAGTRIVPRGTLRVRVGAGTDGLGELFWGLRETAFENVQDAKGAGDGAYLFDPDGDLRVAALYPCVRDCAPPLGDRIRMDVAARGAESVTVTNVSGAPVDLRDHVLKLRNKGKAGQYVFGLLLGSVPLAPGESWTWRPATERRFSDQGGVVELRTWDDRLGACSAWGFGAC